MLESIEPGDEDRFICTTLVWEKSANHVACVKQDYRGCALEAIGPCKCVQRCNYNGQYLYYMCVDKHSVLHARAKYEVSQEKGP